MRSPTLSRLASLFRKEVTESVRDWKMWSMTLSFAPFFVLLMNAYLGHATPVYHLAVVNQDDGAPTVDGETFQAGEELLATFRAVRSEEGDSVLRVQQVDGEQEAEALLESRRADLVVVIPPGFSRALQATREGAPLDPVPLRSRGDPGNPDYLMAAVWADMTAMTYVERASRMESPVYLEAESVGSLESLSEFELYVPGLLALSLMMLMFTAAGALIREKDKGTLIRLRLSNLTVPEWLLAVSATQVLLGMLALALTYTTALAVGYRPRGSLLVLGVVGALTSLSIMAFSVIVAAFLRSVFDLVTVGSFPFFILMFFSGGMFPLPGISLFTVGERVIQLNDILPTTHAIAAMNRVLSYGAGLGDIAYELTAVAGLTIIFFTAGTWLFTRRHLPAGG